MAFFPLFRLPSELILQILSLLAPRDLAITSKSCRKLRYYATDDNLWRVLVQANVPGCKITSPAPCATFRDLYTSINPLWFLLRGKLWFSDTLYTGRLIIVRYSQARQRIEGYAVAAERHHLNAQPWVGNEEVIIHVWDPKVRLDESREQLNLTTDVLAAIPYRQRAFSGVEMPVYNDKFRQWWHTKFQPAFRVVAKTPPDPEILWPPIEIPTQIRSFRLRLGDIAVPHLNKLSKSTFRTRRWMSYTFDEPGVSGSTSNDYETYATLSPELYTSSARKPWKGIYCGDYSGHGCEFIVVMQPDDPEPLPIKALHELASLSVNESQSNAWRAMLELQRPFSSTASPASTPPPSGRSSPAEAAIFSESLQSNGIAVQAEASTAPLQRCKEDERQKLDKNGAIEGSETEQSTAHRGRIEAVKLTGDSNVPRGEYTFIAPDISDVGFIRVADDDRFRGARIVRSVGHIAAEGFRAGKFLRGLTLSTIC